MLKRFLNKCRDGYQCGLITYKNTIEGRELFEREVARYFGEYKNWRSVVRFIFSRSFRKEVLQKVEEVFQKVDEITEHEHACEVWRLKLRIKEVDNRIEEMNSKIEEREKEIAEYKKEISDRNEYW